MWISFDRLGASLPPAHSGIATFANGSSGGVWGYSKWGDGCLVYHQFKTGKYPSVYGNTLNVFNGYNCTNW